MRALYPGPPTREHKSLLNNAIRLDGVVFIVRRIGMTKPPVKLGVDKKFLEKRKEPPSDRMKLVWQPQHFNICLLYTSQVFQIMRIRTIVMIRLVILPLLITLRKLKSIISGLMVRFLRRKDVYKRQALT